MTTIKLPPGIPPGTWAVMLRDVWTKAFHGLLLACVKVRVVGGTGVVLYDPHLHRFNPETRGALRQQIKLHADPGVADLITLVLLGTD